MKMFKRGQILKLEVTRLNDVLSVRLQERGARNYSKIFGLSNSRKNGDTYYLVRQEKFGRMAWNQRFGSGGGTLKLH